MGQYLTVIVGEVFFQDCQDVPVGSWQAWSSGHGRLHMLGQKGSGFQVGPQSLQYGGENVSSGLSRRANGRWLDGVHGVVTLWA